MTTCKRRRTANGLTLWPQWQRIGQDIGCGLTITLLTTKSGLGKTCGFTTQLHTRIPRIVNSFAFSASLNDICIDLILNPPKSHYLTLWLMYVPRGTCSSTRFQVVIIPCGSLQSPGN